MRHVPAALVSAVLILGGCGGRSHGHPTDGGEDGGDEDAGLVEVWHGETGTGFEGSPSLCDLDGDGRPELLAPVDINETMPPNPGRTRAFDAETGAIRWTSPMGTGGYGAPYCLDVNNDGVEDALVTGRIDDVVALSGKTGKPLWSLLDRNPAAVEGHTYTVTAAADDKGILFATTGGGGEPTMGFDEIAGHVIAFNPAGDILASLPVPDDRATYTSTAVWKKSTHEWLVAFGSGGERVPGVLGLAKFDDRGNTFELQWGVPSACDDGGFVASPVAADVDGSGDLVVVDIDFCGTVHAVDLDGNERWTASSDVLYGAANPLPVELDGTPGLELVVVFISLNYSLKEETSDNPRSRIMALDGDGTVLWQQQINDYVFASPVSIDLGGDDRYEVALLTANQGSLRILGPEDGAQLFRGALGGTAGTPTVTDLDSDGALEFWLVDAAAAPDSVAHRFTLRGLSGLPGDSGFRGNTRDGVGRPVHR